MEASELRNSDSFYEASADTFWDIYGDVSGIESKELFMSFWQDAQSRYPDVQGHSFGHAVDVLWTSMELADLC